MDTQGLVLKAKVHAASVFDRDGVKPLLKQVEQLFPRLSHLWLDAGYNGKGKGKDWVEKVLGLSAEVVRPPRRWVWGYPRARSRRHDRLSRSCRGGG